MPKTMNPWSKEEQQKLRSLRLDPIRDDREKLLSIIKHFKNAGGVWGISDGANGPLHISTTLARKIRDLTNAGELDWVLDATYTSNLDFSVKPIVEEHSLIPALSPELTLCSPDVSIRRDTEDDKLFLYVATIEVSVIGNNAATDCSGHLVSNEFNYPLCWASDSTIATIYPKQPVRLKVAFSSNKAGEGCWIYEPKKKMDPNLPNYLAPKKYYLWVHVKSSGGQEVSRRFTLTSPEHLDGLQFEEYITPIEDIKF
jgi:hypothetical protein